MNVRIVARTALSPVEMFNLAVEHGVTAILDLRRTAGPVPASLHHVYQHPPAWALPRFAERLFAHWSCSLTCDEERSGVCEGPYVLLLLTDDDEASTAVDFIRRVRPPVRSLDGLW